MNEIPVLISAGQFDTRKLRKGMLRTPERAVIRYEIELYYDDEGSCIINGVEYPIHRGQLLISRPGDRRSSNFPYKCQHLHFYTDNPVFHAVLNNMDVMTNVDDFETYSQQMQQIELYFYANDPFAKYAAISELIRFIQMLRQHYLYTRQKDMSPSDRSIITMALQYIEANYSDNLIVEDIAAICHVSSSYLYKLFARQLGVSPHDILMERRLTEAKRLLANEHISINSIAMLCGFSSASYFSDCFKRKTGFSPTVFRKEKRYQP